MKFNFGIAMVIARLNWDFLHGSLFRNKRFMLDEMFRKNASKFAILLEYENPR